MKIRFWLRKNKINSRGKAPLYCYISVNGKRCSDFSINAMVTVSQWNAKEQLIYDNLPLQERLTIISYELKKIYNLFLAAGEPFTATDIKTAYLKRFHPAILPDICRFFDDFIRYQAKLIGKEREPRTIQGYKTRFNNLKEYLNNRIIPIDKIDLKFAGNFAKWLKTEKGHSHNYAMKHIQILQHLLKEAIKEGIITDNPLRYFELKISKPHRKIYLTQEELKKMEKYKFKQNRLQRVADLFVFECYTGLCYSEIFNFNFFQHIFKGPDKKLWIRITRQKTNNNSSIPLRKKPLAILKKYDYQLPVISNQKYNSYLKEIADIVGIEKRLTTHVARKTFGTILLNEYDVPIETVSYMLGHKSITTTENHYVEVTEKKIARNMVNVV